MPLTATKLRAIKPSSKTKKVFDGKGMYLEVSPKGGTWWRLKYRIDGKEKRISLGVYPEVSLKEARSRRDVARTQIANGIASSEEANDHMCGPVNAANPVGVEYDPEEWRAEVRTGKPMSDFLVRRPKLENDQNPFLPIHLIQICRV